MKPAIYIGETIDERIWCDEHQQLEHFFGRYGIRGRYEPLVEGCDCGFFFPEAGSMRLFVSVNDVKITTAGTKRKRTRH